MTQTIRLTPTERKCIAILGDYGQMLPATEDKLLFAICMPLRYDKLVEGVDTFFAYRKNGDTTLEVNCSHAKAFVFTAVILKKL